MTDSCHFPSHHCGSSVTDDRDVFIAESEAVEGQATTTLLKDVANIAVVLPRP